MTKKPVVSDTKDLETATMRRNNKKNKWCTSCNNGNGAWLFHWKGGHDEWENKQSKKSSLCFSNHTNNEMIYCSYQMTTIEDSK